MHSALYSSQQHCYVSGDRYTVYICILYWSTDEQLSGYTHAGLYCSCFEQLYLVLLTQCYPLMLRAGDEDATRGHDHFIEVLLACGKSGQHLITDHE